MPQIPQSANVLPVANVQNNNFSLSLPVEGCIETLTSQVVSGWAWTPCAPQQSLQIQVVTGEKVVAQGTANLPRADLMAAGKGTGLYGFRLYLEEGEIGGTPTAIKVLVSAGLDLLFAQMSPPSMDRPHTIDSLSGLVHDHTHFTRGGEDFEEFDPDILRGIVAAESALPLLLAFYLPQFHAIPENDKNWGRGFTEWRQLPKGLPRFPGHYQPRIPRDLGFYDLTHVETLRAQIDLARAAGIGGLAFYYYRFNDRRLLEAPLDLFLRGDLEMPFIIIWANHDWIRARDGMEHQVLMEQGYRETDDESLIDDLARHFVDRRYIRLRGRPLFVIYSPAHIPDARSRIQRWRGALASKCGIEPLIFMAQTYNDRDPRVYGLDGALEFPPHKLADLSPECAVHDAYSREFTGRVVRYDSFVHLSLAEEEPEFPLIKTAVPAWDNEARYPNRGLSLTDLSPKKYQVWLESLLLRSMTRPTFGTPIVAINAWNEWAEGAYLEPDVYYGASFLNATARAYRSALTKISAK